MKDVKIPLDYPLTIDGKEVKELTMRRAKVRDLISASEAGSTAAVQEVALFSKMIGINPEDMQEMDACDYTKIQVAYQGFFVLSAKECRVKVLALARFSGWGLTELCDLTCDELKAWMDSAGIVQELEN